MASLTQIIMGEKMTKVFTDQLAALPISEVEVRSIEGGLYAAYVALEGKLLRVYEVDNSPLSRRSVGDIKSVLLENGCGVKAFLVHHSAYDEMIGIESAVEPDMKIALA